MYSQKSSQDTETNGAEIASQVQRSERKYQAVRENAGKATRSRDLLLVHSLRAYRDSSTA